jgi:hypothetical protein
MIAAARPMPVSAPVIKQRVNSCFYLMIKPMQVRYDSTSAKALQDNQIT